MTVNKRPQKRKGKRKKCILGNDLTIDGKQEEWYVEVMLNNIQTYRHGNGGFDNEINKKERQE